MGRHTYWMCFVFLMLLVTTTKRCCDARTAAKGYDVAPGDVHVLINTTLTLPWETSTQNDFIRYCNWQHWSPGAIGWDRFVGYDNIKKERVQHSGRHVGWEFMNTVDPCQGGIYRHNAQQNQGGRYEMTIKDTDQQEFKAHGEITVLTETKVRYNIQIQNSNYSLTLRDPVPMLPTLDIHSGEYIDILVELHDNFPPSNITVSQDGKLVIFCHDIMVCQSYWSYPQADPNGTIEIRIDPDIQGAQPVIVEQLVSVTGTGTVSDTCGICALGIAMSILFVILFIIVTVLVIIGWKKYWVHRSVKSRKQASEDTPLQDTKSTSVGELKYQNQIESIYIGLQDDAMKLTQQESDATVKYQRQIDSFQQLSDTVEQLQKDAKKIRDDLEIIGKDVDKILTLTSQIISTSETRLSNCYREKSKSECKNYIRDGKCMMKVAHTIVDTCLKSSTAIVELIQELTNIEGEIGQYVEISMPEMKAIADEGEACRTIDPVVKTETNPQPSREDLKAQLSRVSTLCESLRHRRQILDDLKSALDDQSIKYHQVAEHIQELERKYYQRNIIRNNLIAKRDDLYNSFNTIKENFKFG